MEACAASWVGRICEGRRTSAATIAERKRTVLGGAQPPGGAAEGQAVGGERASHTRARRLFSNFACPRCSLPADAKILTRGDAAVEDEIWDAAGDVELHTSEAIGRKPGRRPSPSGVRKGVGKSRRIT